jgi:hypothetical protein
MCVYVPLSLYLCISVSFHPHASMCLYYACLLFHRHTHPKDKSGDSLRSSMCTVSTEASSRNLQDEIIRLQENVDKKDSMLSMLTEGLKEVC